MAEIEREEKREYFLSIPQVAVKAKAITTKGTKEKTESIGACKLARGICPASTPPGLIFLSTILPLIPPITIPTINIDQTTETSLERFSSSEISTSKAVKGVELELTAKP